MLRQNFGGLVLAVWVVGGVLADIDLTCGTAQPDTDFVDGEIAGGVADGAEDCLLYTSLLSISFSSSLARYGGDVAVGAMTVITSASQLCTMPISGTVSYTHLDVYKRQVFILI